VEAAVKQNQDAAKTLLEVNNIEVIYNHVILVLKGVSLKVAEGGITALLGGNGAGKTTTLKAVSNLLHSERGEVTKGSISYRGDAVAGLDPADMVKRGVIQVTTGAARSQRILRRSTAISHGWPNDAARRRAIPLAGSNRCAPLAAR